jgi:hypothetical protein
MNKNEADNRVGVTNTLSALTTKVLHQDISEKDWALASLTLRRPCDLQHLGFGAAPVLVDDAVSKTNCR